MAVAAPNEAISDDQLTTVIARPSVNQKGRRSAVGGSCGHTVLAVAIQPSFRRELLHLSSARGLTDAALSDLKLLKKLEELNLTSTKMTSAGIESLKKALPKCKIQWDGSK